jgi:hypothetical protein
MEATKKKKKKDFNRVRARVRVYGFVVRARGSGFRVLRF